MRALIKPPIPTTTTGGSRTHASKIRFLAAFRESDFRLLLDMPHVQFQVLHSLDQQDVGRLMSFSTLLARFSIPMHLPLALQHLRILAFNFHIGVFLIGTGNGGLLRFATRLCMCRALQSANAQVCATA